MQRFITYLIILFLYSSGSAQYDYELIFQDMDKLGSLTNNSINSIAEDSLGFLWLGTKEGLFRFDSPNSIKIFKRGDIGLESNIIKTITKGSNDHLWIGTTFGGLTRYNIKKNSSRTYANASDDRAKLTSLEILCVNEISPSEVWVGSEGGLDILFPNQDSIYSYSLPSDEGKIKGSVLNISKDENGWIWVTTWEHGIYLYLPHPSGDHSKGEFRQIFRTHQEKVNTNTWKIIAQDSRHYWLATHGKGLGYMKLPSNATNEIGQQNWEPQIKYFMSDSNDNESLSNDYTRDIEYDSDGNLWIGTTNGLNLLPRQAITDLLGDIKNSSPNFKIYRQNQQNDNSINDNNITALYLDRNELMWIGSSSGINQFNKSSNRFKRQLIPSLYLDEGKQIAHVNCVKSLDTASLILGTYGKGIIGFDLEKKVIKDLPFTEKIIGKNVIAMLIHDEKTLYISSDYGVEIVSLLPPYEVQRYKRNDLINGNSNSLDPTTDAIDSTPIFITSLFKDDKGRLWAGTTSSLLLIDEVSKTWINIGNSSMTDIHQDSNGQIWVSSYRGLWQVVESGDNISIQSFTDGDDNLRDAMLNNQILNMNEYNNTLYFGSTNGIFTYDLLSKKLESLEMEGSKNSINNMVITNEGVLWSCIPTGILRFDIESNIKDYYSDNDGVKIVTNRNHAGLDLNDGKVLFGCQGGFVSLNKSDWEQSSKSHKTLITTVKELNENSEITANTLGLTEYDIAPDNFSVEIQFSNLNYNKPEKTQFAYRLDGFDSKDWIYTKDEKTNYTNLDPGKYTFLVKSANEDGTWSDNESSLQLNVKPKFKETNLFKAIVFLAILGVTLLLITLYTNNIIRRNAILKDYNLKLNKEIFKTEAANKLLADRDKEMQILVGKLDTSNKELTRSNKDLEQYAYIASHDLQEPLRTVGAFSSVLKESIAEQNNAELNQYTAFIEQGVERMSDLINSILTYSLIGKEVVELESIEVNTLVKGKLEGLSEYIKERNAKVNVEVLPTILCHKEQIGTVFYNLILNGLKFNKNKVPMVNVSIEETIDEWIFHVSDNGIGIHEDQQANIFEIFKRLHLKHEYEGTGIGLALCNKIINNHKGQLTVQSKEGEGSTFSFSVSKNLSMQSPITT